MMLAIRVGGERSHTGGRMASRLGEAEIAEAVERLDGWAYDGDDRAISRKFIFDDFDEAMSFILEVADIAREMDHHPELFNVYNEVALSMTTHDAGGVTARDVAFAERVEALFEDGDETP